MNMVKRGVLMCVGLLLALIVLQGAQSLWQMSRLSGTIDDLVIHTTVNSETQRLWSTFFETDAQLKAVVSFVDGLAAREQRDRFSAQLKSLADMAAKIDAMADEDLKSASGNVVQSVARWSQLASPHLSGQGLTELPSYHLLDEARSELQVSIGVLVQSSSAQAAELAAAGQERARFAMVWTVVELALAVVLGVATAHFALAGMRRQIGGEASDVAALTNAVADGDLTATIQSDDLPAGSVMAATARMQRSLIDTVSRVRAISQNLSSGVGEIATGNNDLSSRTEQQATALERTAATMEELGTTVRHNADSAREANQLAQGAVTIAHQGGAVVGQVVDTMKGINDSSKKIADIIGVIDGIAFQTNILALNAAVEAARAGEQGRGFAVVASEVRSLAQRSAEAAKQIKGLIQASVEQVGQGTQLVDQAGVTMQEVVAAIERVTRIIGEISHASTEQSAGVAQVGQAVAELDQATQQNAALAEQSAAAAESLKSQAHQLIEAVSVFKLAGR
jgi:methyl-accepting chemotaxis protein